MSGDGPKSGGRGESLEERIIRAGKTAGAEAARARGEVAPEVVKKAERDAELIMQEAEIVGATRDRIAALEELIATAETTAKWLDKVPLDALAGWVVPGLADVAAAVPGMLIVAQAHKLGVPKSKLMRMIANLGIDIGVGAIPGVGDLFDFFWKANKSNARILKEHLAELRSGRAS